MPLTMWASSRSALPIAGCKPELLYIRSSKGATKCQKHKVHHKILCSVRVVDVSAMTVLNPGISLESTQLTFLP